MCLSDGDNICLWVSSGITGLTLLFWSLIPTLMRNQWSWLNQKSASLEEVGVQCNCWDGGRKVRWRIH